MQLYTYDIRYSSTLRCDRTETRRSPLWRMSAKGKKNRKSENLPSIDPFRTSLSRFADHHSRLFRDLFRHHCAKKEERLSTSSKGNECFNKPVTSASASVGHTMHQVRCLRHLWNYEPSASVGRHLLKFRWNNLLSIVKNLDQLACKFALFHGDVAEIEHKQITQTKQRTLPVSGTRFTRTTSTTDTVNVVFDTVRHVVVDDIANVLDI